MNMSLENKVALVTGGTSGIGKAAALALAQAGAKVVVSGRREEEGRAVELAIKKVGGNTVFVRADVSQPWPKGLFNYSSMSLHRPRQMLKSKPKLSLCMNAVIIYQDIAYAIRSASLLQRVGHQQNVRVEWAMRYWSSRALDEPAMAEMALEESLDAHLIILPSGVGQSLPPHLLTWLECWAQQRQIPDAALGILIGEQFARLASSLSSELPDFLRRHDLNLITDRGAVAENRIELRTNFRPEQETLLPVKRFDYGHLLTAHPYRNMGINE